MRLSLVKVNIQDLMQYRKDMQEAFQKGFEDVYGRTESIVLPEKDIDCSLNKKGAIAYKAVFESRMIGGAVVVIDSTMQHNHLDLLYVKHGTQIKGIGYAIWSEIKKLHSDTKVWETCTPYFEKRNIHFYVNKCGFHIVEFQNRHTSKDFIGDGGDGMFVFQKRMQL